MNGWPKDPKLSEIGRYVQMTMDNDIEGEYPSFAPTTPATTLAFDDGTY